MFANNKIYFPINAQSHGEGPPVILVHGMAASLRQWDLLIPQLVEAGFSAHALDLQGHGDSAKPEEVENYHIEIFFDQFTKWIDGLGFNGTPFSIVSHSMGAYLSLLFALRFPKRVQMLVLTDPLYSPKQLSPFLRLAMRNPNPGIRILEKLPPWIFDLVLRWTEQTQSRVPTLIRRQLAIDFKRASSLILYTARTIRDMTPQIPRIQIPSLVIWGKKDLTLSPGSFPRLVRSLPQATSYSFPQCGHIPHLTQAAIYNQKVLDFITSQIPA
jgi:abhydrolase domain-containing protein 6